ncbi:MAG: hypothetical protein SGJ02_10590 [bacterium]|nr:hypothetical protein [bacterium]
MKVKGIIFVLIVLLFALNAASDDTIVHNVPEYSFGQDLVLKISAESIRRARVLISDENGVKLKDLERVGESFEVGVNFTSLALLKYGFQVEFEDGEIQETPYYYIRQPSSVELESNLRELNDSLSYTQSRIKQVENGLSNLNGSEETAFKKQKSEELGKALLILRKKEKEKQDLEARIDLKISDWQKKSFANQNGEFITKVRKDLEADNEKLWDRK